MKTIFPRLFLIVLGIMVFFIPEFSLALDFNPAQLCPPFIKDIDNQCDKMGEEECRETLEECEKYYQKRSEDFQKEISVIEQKEKTLKNEIWALDNKIKNLNYKIYENNLIIKDLNFQIKDTKNSIENTSVEIENMKERLGQLLQLRYEYDKKSLLEILLIEEEISDFFADLVALDAINKETQELIVQIEDLNISLKNQKEFMVEEKEELENTQILVQVQKNESQNLQREKGELLERTKGQEALYQSYLEESKKKAQEIRERIFELAGTTEAPTFGEAYEIAKNVEKITGVRPAFLLAILRQESDIGKNVGQCYLTNVDTGSGKVIYNGKIVSRIMKPTRDVNPFLSITEELGRDPYKTPISCPLSIGYGGAMGPAQFIPSTWILYREELEGILKRPADPWKIKDAFLASALYLSKCGAKSQTRNGEWKAAMIYFSGSTTNSNFYWYANQVLNKADEIEKEIQLIS